MISGYSRYANSKIQLLRDASHANPVPTIIPPSPGYRLFNYTEYLVEWNDRIEMLAYRFYNDPGLWWKIADANPEILLWTDLVPGTILRIPNVS